MIQSLFSVWSNQNSFVLNFYTNLYLESLKGIFGPVLDCIELELLL